jgi:hypothetical protein
MLKLFNMKKLLLVISMVSATISANAQCTPVNCQASLTYPDLGGVCDTVLTDATVNNTFSDFESFLITGACFDAGLIDPGSAGTNVKIKTIDNFTFSGMPVGLTGVTSQGSYTSPGTMNSDNTQTLAGCVAFSGTPTEIGVFNVTMNFLVDVLLCDLFYIEQSNNAASYVLWLTVKPNPTFTGLSANYCVTDAPVNLTVTGTPGGTFTGPGVTGSSFNPAAAGPGSHEIKYTVAKQEGAAIAPAADSMVVLVNVTGYYADVDNDGYGDPASTPVCTAQTGFVANYTDCDDSNVGINPNATEIAGNGIDEDCSGTDATAGIDELVLQQLQVYPNPSTGSINVNFNNITIQSVDIADLNGRVVNSLKVNSKSVEMDLSTLQNGVYLMSISTEKGTVQRRIAIQK